MFTGGLSRSSLDASASALTISNGYTSQSTAADNDYFYIGAYDGGGDDKFDILLDKLLSDNLLGPDWSQIYGGGECKAPGPGVNENQIPTDLPKHNTPPTASYGDVCKYIKQYIRKI